MPITPSYDTKALAPRVRIFDYTGALQHTYEADPIAASPVKDFDLTDLKIHLGVNGDYGNAILLINDRNDLFTDATLRRGADFKRQWQIQIQLGKTSATLNRWFYGRIYDAQIVRQQTGDQQVMLSCLGWGSILRERITQIVRNQDKTSDGITLDDADIKTRLDNLIEDIFTDTDHQIDENIAQLTNITRTGVCADCLNIKITNINEVANTYAGFISRLATISNTIWYVDPDRDLIMRDPETHDSGFLFTSDLPGTDAQNWSSTKIGYLKNQPISWNDSSFDSMYTHIHAHGSFNPKLMASDGQTPDASDNLDTAWHAIPIIPTEDTLFKIAIRAIKTGTPASGPGEILIVGGDGGTPEGPEDLDVRRTISLTETRLQSLGTSTPATFFEIPIKPRLPVVVDEPLFIIFKKYGTATNTYNVNYKTATGNFWDSGDGLTWTQRTGQSAYRIYSARRLLVTLEDTNMSR